MPAHNPTVDQDLGGFEHSHLPHVVVLRVLSFTDQGNLRALVSIRVDPWIIHGCRVIQEPGKRAWASLPQSQSRFSGRWFPVVELADKAIEDAIKAAVLQAWESHSG